MSDREDFIHGLRELADFFEATQNARKTHCKRGHAFTPENTRIYNGDRLCRACSRLQCQKSRQAKKAVA